MHAAKFFFGCITNTLMNASHLSQRACDPQTGMHASAFVCILCTRCAYESKQPQLSKQPNFQRTTRGDVAHMIRCANVYNYSLTGKFLRFAASRL